MNFVESVRRRARLRTRRIVFPEGTEPRTLQAVTEIQRAGLLFPVLLGAPDEVVEALAREGGDPEGVEVVDPASLEGVGRYVRALLDRRRAKGMTEPEARERVREPLMRGALMVALGEVDGSVAGAVSSTGEVLRAAIWCVGTQEGIRVVSSSFYMLVPAFRGSEPEVLTFTDGAVVPEPTSEQLAHIAASAARARRRVVGDSPVVAFLSYSTRGSAEGASVTKVRRALETFRAMEPGVPADGEFQADAALVEAVARRKAPHSAVGGVANVLVFPNLDAANISYKLVQRIANAGAVGPIVQGLCRPCNDLSRGASSEDIVNVACITALMSE